MNSILDCSLFALRILLLSSIFIFGACSSQPTEPTDENTTEPDVSDTKTAETDANQASSLEADYPLDFCVVSGNDFGEDPNMIPYVHLYNGTPIKFCCKPCLPRFEKDPERYLKFMREEIEALAK